MRDRIYINGTLRDGVLKEWDEKNILGIHMMGKKDIFLLAVAMGLDSPEDIRSKKDGYFLLKDVKSSNDKALFASVLLGKPENQENVDLYANDDINYDEAERCAEAGFRKLKELIDDAGGDNELLEERAFAKLRYLYQKNVKTNL